MSYKTMLVLIFQVFACSSFGGGITQEHCDYIACGKFTVENGKKAKVRCADYKTKDDLDKALLVDDTLCTLHVSKAINKKQIHYLVLTAPKKCELKKGDQVEMRIRGASFTRGTGFTSPCPNGTYFFKRPEDNPPIVIDGKPLETNIDVNFLGT